MSLLCMHGSTPKDSKCSSRPEVLQHRSLCTACGDVPSGETRKRCLDSPTPVRPTRQRSPMWEQRLEAHLDATPELKTMYQQWGTHCPGKVHFKLPRLGALSGSILRHSSEVMERICHAEYPLIFKICFTHNPFWRWSNNKYGYAFAPEKWSNMIVLYVSSECHSVSMPEAALIDKYKSISTVPSHFFWFSLLICPLNPLRGTHVGWFWIFSGRPNHYHHHYTSYIIICISYICRDLYYIKMGKYIHPNCFF